MKKMFTKSLVAALLLTGIAGAQAVQKDITLTATVDPSLDMTLSDGSAIPASQVMQYLPGIGLEDISMMTKIWSNDATKDLNMRLVSQPQLVNTTGATATPVPLSVSWGGQALSTTDTQLTAADLFPSGKSDQGSVAKELRITQSTKGALSAGNYSGVVSIYLTQQP
ncbi:fimbrial protein [Enterobacter cloacae]|uniref:CS1 type fimbrial major subunit n=1 Tax=Enterobacter cloacae TaxID=550 RepID=UPI0034A4C0EA